MEDFQKIIVQMLKVPMDHQKMKGNRERKNSRYSNKKNYDNNKEMRKVSYKH